MGVSRRSVLTGTVSGGLMLTTGAAKAQFGVSPTLLPRLTGNQRVIIDTDPGNDDALAILMALDAPNLKVEAITVCPGNVRYEQEVRNALFLVDLAGKGGKIPVHAGMTHSILSRPYPTATFIHGPDGLGKVSVPEVKQKVDKEHAVDAIRRLVNLYPGEILIMALGGITNVAMALLREPAIAPKIKAILWVGGNFSAPGGAPSYNVLVDPEAAHVVLTSGVPITMVGRDTAGDSIMTDADFAHAETFNTPKSRFYMQSNELRRTFEMQARGTKGATNPDPIAVATVIDPSIATEFKAVYLKVELEGTLTRGVLVYGDNLYNGQPTPPPNVNICTKISNEGFKAIVFKTLSHA
jgi:purine nucleosidase